MGTRESLVKASLGDVSDGSCIGFLLLIRKTLIEFQAPSFGLALAWPSVGYYKHKGN